jgi:hypothetical protein
VLLWDRRNMGASGIAFGSAPLPVEETLDLMALLTALNLGPVRPSHSIA